MAGLLSTNSPSLQEIWGGQPPPPISRRLEPERPADRTPLPPATAAMQEKENERRPTPDTGKATAHKAATTASLWPAMSPAAAVARWGPGPAWMVAGTQAPSPLVRSPAARPLDRDRERERDRPAVPAEQSERHSAAPAATPPERRPPTQRRLPLHEAAIRGINHAGTPDSALRPTAKPQEVAAPDAVLEPVVPATPAHPAENTESDSSAVAAYRTGARRTRRATRPASPTRSAPETSAVPRLIFGWLEMAARLLVPASPAPRPSRRALPAPITAAVDDAPEWLSEDVRAQLAAAHLGERTGTGVSIAW